MNRERKDKQNVDSRMQLFKKLEIILSNNGINELKHEFILKCNAMESKKIILALPELLLYVKSVNNIINGTFAPNIDLSNRLKSISIGIITIKTMYKLNSDNFISKDSMSAMIIHLHAVYQLIHIMKSDESLKHEQLLLLYIGSDLSEITHFYLRCCTSLYKQLTILSIHDRLKYVQKQIEFALSHPELVPSRKRNKSGDHMNIASYKSDLYVSKVDLSSILSDFILSVKQSFMNIVDNENYDGDLLQKINKYIDEPLYKLDSNVFTFTAEQKSNYDEDLKLYEDI